MYFEQLTGYNWNKALLNLLPAFLKSWERYAVVILTVFIYSPQFPIFILGIYKYSLQKFCPRFVNELRAFIEMPPIENRRLKDCGKKNTSWRRDSIRQLFIPGRHKTLGKNAANNF